MKKSNERARSNSYACLLLIGQCVGAERVRKKVIDNQNDTQNGATGTLGIRRQTNPTGNTIRHHDSLLIIMEWQCL